MPKYRITETAPATAVWVYYVDAETEEEALELIYNGKIEDVYSETEIDLDKIEIENVEVVED